MQPIGKPPRAIGGSQIIADYKLVLLGQHALLFEKCRLGAQATVRLMWDATRHRAA
jgi:hypothetical protein